MKSSQFKGTQLHISFTYLDNLKKSRYLIIIRPYATLFQWLNHFQKRQHEWILAGKSLKVFSKSIWRVSLGLTIVNHLRATFGSLKSVWTKSFQKWLTFSELYEHLNQSQNCGWKSKSENEIASVYSQELVVTLISLDKVNN